MTLARAQKVSILGSRVVSRIKARRANPRLTIAEDLRPNTFIKREAIS